MSPCHRQKIKGTKIKLLYLDDIRSKQITCLVRIMPLACAPCLKTNYGKAHTHHTQTSFTHIIHTNHTETSHITYTHIHHARISNPHIIHI